MNLPSRRHLLVPVVLVAVPLVGATLARVAVAGPDKPGAPAAGKAALAAACAHSVEEIGPKPGRNEGNDPRNLRERWQPVVQAATRAQFVTVTKKFEALNIVGTNYYKRTVLPGEPLLVESCFTQQDYSTRPASVRVLTMRLRTIDGEFEHSVEVADIDPAPAAFTWETPPYVKATTLAAALDADAADIAAVAGLTALRDEYNDCRTESLGYCMAAEQKVAAGPRRANLKAAKEKACTDATRKRMATCFPKAKMTKLQKLADQLDALSAQRHDAYHAAIRAKLATP